MTTTVTSKGQVTIPKPVREHLGLRAGSAVSFEMSDRGEVVLRPVGRKAKARASRFAHLRGRATVKMGTEQILTLTRRG